MIDFLFNSHNLKTIRCRQLSFFMTKGRAVTASPANPFSTFKDTGLPQHPAIEQAFAELKRLDTNDSFTTRGVKIASIIANESVTQDPEAIAAGLLVPLASDHGPVLLAKAALPGRVPEIIQSLFDFGGMALSDEPTETFYKSLDPAVRSVILAASVRMFDAAAAEMEKAPPQEAASDADYLNRTLETLRHFTAMVSRAESDEHKLVVKCQKALHHIETAVGKSATPAAAPQKPAPKGPQN